MHRFTVMVLFSVDVSAISAVPALSPCPCTVVYFIIYVE